MSIMDIIKDTIGKLWMPGIIFALSVDLLYLYFSGAWCDPIKWIEYTEVALLIIFTVVSMISAVIAFKKIREVK